MDKFELLKNFIHTQFKDVNVNDLTKSEQSIIIETARIASIPEPDKDPNFVEKSKVIQKIVENLEVSTKKDWEMGYIDDWAEHAKKMKAQIKASVNLLKLM